MSLNPYTDLIARFKEIRAQADGIIYQQLLPQHIVIVQKHNDRLSLGLPCPVSEMTQSVLNLADPLHLTAPYNQAFCLSFMWHPTPQRVFIAGVGGGTFPLVLHYHLPQCHLDCVDLDGTVCQIAQTYFGLRPDETLTVTVHDARAYLTETPQQYDVMIIDVFMGSGFTPYPLVTQEFYRLCAQRLTEKGVIAINMPHDETWFADKVKTLQSIFQYIYICRVEMGNSVVIGTNAPYLSKQAIIDKARQWQSEHRLAFSLLKRATIITPPSDLLEVVPHLPEATLLHDNAPPPGYPTTAPMMRGFAKKS